MDSIFREKRTYVVKSELDQNLNSDKLNYRIVTHDSGMARAREYSLTCKLYFTEYSRFTIEKLIETDINYFTWLPRNIQNFTYDEKALKYAKVCLTFLEKIDNHSIDNSTKLGKAISQVDAMIKYEHHLDFDSNKDMIQYYKMMVNVKYYKSIFNTRTERLIRQAREIDQISSEYRKKYFDEMLTMFHYR